MKLFFDVLLAGFAMLTLGYATVRADDEQITIENPFNMSCSQYGRQNGATQRTLDTLIDEALSRGTTEDRFQFARSGLNAAEGFTCARATTLLLRINALDLSGLGLSDLLPLAGLRNLNTLVLDNNEVTDLSPLSQLSGLRYLSMSRNAIVDVAPLRHLHNLQFLLLRENRISRVSTLASAESLLRLDITGNNVIDFVALQRARHGIRIVGLPRGH